MAVLGAVGGVPMFFLAIAVGTAVTGLATVVLMSRERNADAREPAGDTVVPAQRRGSVPGTSTPEGPAVVTSAGSSAGPEPQPDGALAVRAEVLSGRLTGQSIEEWLRADRKEAAIREMAELLAGTGKVTDTDELRVALAREEQGSTGLGEEIAVPHAKTDAVTEPVVGFARSREGVDWGSLDGTKARLVFMIAAPEAAAGDEHLRVLAQLSRKLTDADCWQRLLEAPGRDAILDVLSAIR